MTPPMESTRTTISLGPIELSFRRNEEGRRIGLPGSIAVHVVIAALAMVLTAHVKRAPTEPERVPTPSPPIPITFVSPIPPAPAPTPPAIEARKRPVPDSPKPLRMQSVPEITQAPRDTAPDRTRGNAGQRDARPAGGQAGGPLETRPGVPDDRGEVQPSSPIDEQKTLQGRLQDFRRALEAPRPSAPKGPKGGGTGRGGVVMPALPDTGYGFGNLQFESSDYDWGDYGRQIHAIIWRAWHNRLLITSSVFERWAAEHRNWMLDHRSAVRFTILRSGQVVDVAIETPSGCFPLDDSAADALREVVLPPLPDDFSRASETVHARFIANGPINGMRTHLQMLKDAGWF
jgi:hypothetical protein